MTTKQDANTTTSSSKSGPGPDLFAPFAAFDPMAAWATAQQRFQAMMTDAHGRTQAWVDEAANIEAQLLARAQGAIDLWAQLARDTLAYTAQLSAQARKLGAETARKAGVGA